MKRGHPMSDPRDNKPMTNQDDRKAEHKIFDRIASEIYREEQLIALGVQPRTWRGRWFWLCHWSPPALWWLKRKRGER